MRITLMRIQTGSIQTTSRGGLKWIESTSRCVSVQSRALTRTHMLLLALARSRSRTVFGALEMSGSWSHEQTRALVSVWSQANVQSELDGVVRNCMVFERIAKEMGDMGYEFSWQQCWTKIKNLTQKYRKASNVHVALGTQALSYNSCRNLFSSFYLFLSGEGFQPSEWNWQVFLSFLRRARCCTRYACCILSFCPP